MAHEELARPLSRLTKRSQSARCCDNLAEFESRSFAELLHRKTPFVGFVFCLSEAQQKAPHKKEMPFLAGQGAWPSALSRARVCVYRSEARDPNCLALALMRYIRLHTSDQVTFSPELSINSFLMIKVLASRETEIVVSILPVGDFRVA